MIVRELFAKLGLVVDKKSFSAADRLMGSVKKALAGIVAYKTVHWAVGLINDTRQTADMFEKMSQQIGISSEALQQLEYAAELGGTNLEVMRVGMAAFARQAYDVSKGSKTAQEMFRALGVKATDSAGKLRPVDEVLMDVADRVAAMPDGTKKSALMMKLFSESGARMIPMLNGGSKELGRLRQEFVDLGAQIDEGSGRSLVSLNDGMFRVKKALAGIRNQAVIALVPVLKELTENLLAWIAANKQLLRQRMEKMLRALIWTLKALGKAVGFAIDHWKELTTVITSVYLGAGILKVIAALKKMGAVSMATAIKSGAAWVFSFWPLVLAAAAVAALILIVEDLWQAFTGGESALAELYEWLIDKMVWAFEQVEKAARAAWDAVGDIPEIPFITSKTAGGATGGLGKVKALQQNPYTEGLVAALKTSGVEKQAAGNPLFAAVPKVRTFERSSNVTSQQTNHITINAKTDASAEEIGREVKKAIDVATFGAYRTADAALGGR